VGGPESRTLDDEGLPRPPAVQGKIPRSVLRILVRAESVMFMAIAVALVVIAVVVFARGVHDLVLAPRGEQFAVTITRAVNSALFIVVVLELVRTMREHGRVVRRAGSGTPVRPAGPGLSGRR
jgi:ABC-type protease/lipase transport system fused ATPase/permease subunit